MDGDQSVSFEALASGPNKNDTMRWETGPIPDSMFGHVLCVEILERQCGLWIKPIVLHFHRPGEWNFTVQRWFEIKGLTDPLPSQPDPNLRGRAFTDHYLTLEKKRKEKTQKKLDELSRELADIAKEINS
jgi:hypothetical protein